MTSMAQQRRGRQTQLARLKAVADRFGAEVDADFQAGILTVWLPEDGPLVWAESGAHCLCEQFDNGSQRWIREAVTELIDRMNDGTEEN